MDGEACFVTLNDGQTFQLTVYDAYARIRDRVQSIVVVPNANGHISFNPNGGFNLTYIVTPASLARVIYDKFIRGEMTVEYLLLDKDGYMTTVPLTNIDRITASYDGYLYLYDYVTSLDTKSMALRVRDNTPGGTDYTTTFSSIDWTSY